MKENEYFKVNSIEELKQAYDMFEDKWLDSYSLEEEIKDFNKGCRNIKYNYAEMYLVNDYFVESCTEIESPLKNINSLNKLI